VAGCLFSSNTTQSIGGAILNLSTLTVASATFFGNTATNTIAGQYGGYGGAIYNAGSITATNSIFWGNQATTDGNQVYNNSNGKTVSVENCDIQGSGLTGANGDIDADPLFVSTTAGALDLHLQSGSPCVNHGNTALLPPDWLDVNGNGNTTEPLPFDLEGKPRVVSTMVDMGCYESSY
jgi:hypothetical protein